MRMVLLLRIQKRTSKQTQLLLLDLFNMPNPPAQR